MVCVFSETYRGGDKVALRVIKPHFFIDDYKYFFCLAKRKLMTSGWMVFFLIECYAIRTLYFSFIETY